MTELRLYNTLTRQTEAFLPKDPQAVRVYCCGPTVYDVPHVGHARSFVAFDVLVRTLRAVGHTVTHVRNVTDIDDKILNRARELGEEPLHLSARMTEIFQEDMDAIGCARPTHEPKVSETLESIFEIIGKLVDNGAAYVVEKAGGKRDVYFSVRSFAGYTPGASPSPPPSPRPARPATSSCASPMRPGKETPRRPSNWGGSP
jgi:cysteinyl-tRNA synthetase